MNGFLSVLITVMLALSLNACGRRTTVMTQHPPPSPFPLPEEEIMRRGGLVIAYEGEDGKTALESLRAHARVIKTTVSGLGELVETINGVAPATATAII